MKSKFIIKTQKMAKLIYWELVKCEYWILHIREENGVNHFYSRDKIWFTTEKGVILTTPFLKITQLNIDDFVDIEQNKKGLYF